MCLDNVSREISLKIRVFVGRHVPICMHQKEVKIFQTTMALESSDPSLRDHLNHIVFQIFRREILL